MYFLSCNILSDFQRNLKRMSTQFNLPRNQKNLHILSFSAIENKITKLVYYRLIYSSRYLNLEKFWICKTLFFTRFYLQQQERKINTFLKIICKIAKACDTYIGCYRENSIYEYRCYYSLLRNAGIEKC